MSLAGAFDEPFVHDALVDNMNRPTQNWINWYNQTTALLNEVFVTGRDSLGVGATNQKTIPFLQVPVMSTATRDSVAGLTNGLIIYNATTNKFQGYAGGVWVDFH